jgi:DASS family divalent anion:Na+ symporter
MGAEIVRDHGLTISFSGWLAAAAVPTLTAMALLPWLLFKLIRPEVTSTPEAPRAARAALAAMGRLSAHEKIVAATFVGMVIAWGAAATVGLDSTAIAFLGLAVLLVTGVLTTKDIAQEGDVLATFIWFAALFTLSARLNELGFMSFLGERLALRLGGLSPALAAVALVATYILLHYLFVSQTAHLLALFGVFLNVGVTLGLPAAPIAFLLLFATNYFSAMTPQASSANLLFAESGFLTQGELYKLGAITTAFNFVVFMAVGTPWVMFLYRQ